MATLHGTNNGDFADVLDLVILDYTDNNIFTNDRSLVTDGTGDEYHSYEGDDVVRAGGGADIIHGHHGNDTLYGEGGNDELNGGDNDDTLFGGSGADELNGGSGIDEILYMGSSSGVTVNLLTGTGSGGHATGDTISGVENMYGSGFGDTLTGTNGANHIEGGYGDDVIEGLDGIDELYGNFGSDTLVGGGENDYLYGDQTNRGEASPFFFSPDYYSDRTSSPDTFDDILRGGPGDDTLDGGSGADELDGGGGEDTITYGYESVFISLEDGTAVGGRWRHFHLDRECNRFDYGRHNRGRQRSQRIGRVCR
jgi:Ca2+-binding RTX toxin-like protein